MSGKRYKPEEIVRHLREADVLLSQGTTVADVVRRLGVNKITYYRWRREFGGMKTDQAKKLKDLERENLRLKRLVADLSLDNAILKEAASGNF
jgi:putative transposase